MHHHAAAGPAYDAAIEATGAAAARWSKLLPAKPTPVPPVFETTSYA